MQHQETWSGKGVQGYSPGGVWGTLPGGQVIPNFPLFPKKVC